MSASHSYKWQLGHQQYLQRQAERDRRHSEYLERQALRDERQQENMERQAARDARQQEYFDRVTESTTRYRDRYQQIFNELVESGYEKYLLSEFSKLRGQLAELNAALHSDPQSAKQLSLQVGVEISRLQSVSSSAKREFEDREKQRLIEIASLRRIATTELGRFLHSLLSEARDPIAQDFAFDSLKALQSEYQQKVIDAVDLQSAKESLQRRVDVIYSDASVLATNWKASKAKETNGEAQQALLKLHREHVAEDAIRYPLAAKAMLASLDDMSEEVGRAGGCSMTDIQEKLAVVSETADTAVADENCRRIVVRAILESLQKTGFVVSAPQREPGEKDEVVIRARKPSGSEASFRVTVDGGMVYKFDHYDGSKCKADIDQVLPMLQEIYGIELSDERVLWQNPDRISQSSKPIEAGNQGKSRG